MFLDKLSTKWYTTRPSYAKTINENQKRETAKNNHPIAVSLHFSIFTSIIKWCQITLAFSFMEPPLNKTILLVFLKVNYRTLQYAFFGEDSMNSASCEYKHKSTLLYTYEFRLSVEIFNPPQENMLLSMKNSCILMVKLFTPSSTFFLFQWIGLEIWCFENLANKSLWISCSFFRMSNRSE